MPEADINQPNTGGIDAYFGPYENWVFRTGSAYGYPGLLPDEKIGQPLSWEFKDKVSTMDLSGKGFPDFGFYFPILWEPKVEFKTKFLPLVFVPPDGPKGLFDTFADLLQALPDTSGSPSATILSTPPSYLRLNQPLRYDTVDLKWSDNKPASETIGKKVVVVAIIDDGIPFAHRNFLSSEGKTRIDFCWSQSAAGGGTPLLFGQEFTGVQIDGLRASYAGDESAIYRAAGLADNPDPRLRFPLDRMHSHGAHVLDTMAGSWPVDSDTQVRIIAVDLPAMASWDTSGFGKDVASLAALHYIFDRADKIGEANGQPDVPLIINMSYGHSGGAHDGTSIIEAAFDELVEHRRKLNKPTALVMPSGNMFLDRVHSVINQHHFDRVRSDHIDQTWFLPPGDRTSSFVEIWLPAGQSEEDVHLELFAPGLDTPLTLERVESANPRLKLREVILDGKVIGQLAQEKYRGLRWRFVIALAPTETYGLEKFIPRDGPPPAAPAGRWRIRLSLVDDAKLKEFTGSRGAYVAGGLQCWIQRDVDYTQANSGALQSYFIDPFDKLFAIDGAPMTRDPTWRHTRTRRFGTLNGMATARSALVVGGYVASECEAAFYSSAGALRHNENDEVIQVGKQVALSAASERSPFHRGIIAAGTRSGITVAQRGTSSASPQVARTLAQAFLNKDVGVSAAGNYCNLLRPGSTECGQPGDGALPGQKYRLGDCLLPLQQKNPNKD